MLGIPRGSSASAKYAQSRSGQVRPVTRRRRATMTRTAVTGEPTRGGGLRVLAVTNLWPEGDSHRGVFVAEQVRALRRLGVRVDIEVVAQSRGVKDYLLATRRVRRRARA